MFISSYGLFFIFGISSYWILEIYMFHQLIPMYWRFIFLSSTLINFRLQVHLSPLLPLIVVYSTTWKHKPFWESIKSCDIIYLRPTKSMTTEQAYNKMVTQTCLWRGITTWTKKSTKKLEVVGCNRSCTSLEHIPNYIMMIAFFMHPFCCKNKKLSNLYLLGINCTFGTNIGT